SYDIKLNLTDGQVHRVAVYATDWDNVVGAYPPGQQARSERFDVINTATGQVLDSETLSSFKGTYLVWNLQGNVTIQVTNLGSGYNGVVSALFFGPAPVGPTTAASFAGSDATTQGKWRTAYGGDGFDIAQDPNGVNLPSYAQVSVTGATNFTWSTNSGNP